jgi:hypothetical protein
MKIAVAIVLMVIGGLIILGPLAAHSYSSNRQKERIAEFYSRTTNAAVLPDAMSPEPYSVYDFVCFAAGAVCLATGIARSRSA